MSENATDWIKPGVEVLVYNKNSTWLRPRQVKVERVASKSFTLVGVDERIYLDGMESKRIGSQYSGWSYRVVRMDSDEARDVMAKARRAGLESAARNAVDEWQKSRTRKNRLAAIEALQRVED